MYTINFQKPEHIHFIGIGGISMSGLAEVLLQKGFTVSGSDASESALVKKLESKGARIFIGQRASNIQSGIDAVVYTAAIHKENPEFAECVKQNIPLMTRAELLGQLMKKLRVSHSCQRNARKDHDYFTSVGDPCCHGDRSDPVYRRYA